MWTSKGSCALSLDLGWMGEVETGVRVGILDVEWMACAKVGSGDLWHVQEIGRCPTDLGPKVKRNPEKMFWRQMHKRPKMMRFKRWFGVGLGVSDSYKQMDERKSWSPVYAIDCKS